MDGAADSPAPSPIFAGPKGKGGQRGGSVPAMRDGKEASVKPEDGVGDSIKLAMLDKLRLLPKGSEVAYKQAKQKGVEGQWIQCVILSVLGDGLKTRYALTLMRVYVCLLWALLMSAAASKFKIRNRMSLEIQDKFSKRSQET
jgi:hypothetical protein